MAHPASTGIILASFGAGNEQGKAALAGFEERVKAVFPACPVRWAFTGHRAANGNRTFMESVRELADSGVNSLALQPLQLIPGTEFESLLREAAEGHTGRRIRHTALGLPLLGGEGAVPALAKLMSRVFPPDHDAGEAVVWVGHGTPHSGQGHYDDLARALAGRENGVFLGTLRPDAQFDAMAAQLTADGFTTIRLVPFFSLLGRHAARDILGEGPHSWRGRLEAMGFHVRAVNQGMLEEPRFAALWLERLRAALGAIR